MAVAIGLDLGASFLKGVLVQEDGGEFYELTGFGKSYRISGREMIASLLKKAGRNENEIYSLGVTGSGSGCIPPPAKRYHPTKALAAGVFRRVGKAAVVIDLGGQAGRVCQIDDRGGLEKFQASEYCASGSGKLLENVSHVLQIPLAEFGTLALSADHAVAFTTGCAVFAESEAISAVSHGEPASAIIAGCHQAVATKILNLMNGWSIQDTVVAATGGGALNSGLVHLLEDRLGRAVTVPPPPQFITALGAAYLAAE